jgi:hypothetical protein
MSAHLEASIETPDHEANRSSSGTGMGMLAMRWSIRHLSTWTLGLVVAMAPAPAMADTKVFDDPVGDSTFVDISRVRVVHRDSVIVRVRSAVPLTTDQVFAFWIDAGHGPRPDYYVDFRANTGFDEVLRRVRFFGDRRSRFVQCPGLRLRADILTDKPVSIRIPRRCMKNPGSVRVAVQFKDESKNTVDWAVDHRTFGPWVKR